LNQTLPRTGIKSSLARLISSKSLRLAVGLGLSALTLYLALRNVDFADVWSAISQANGLYIGLALVSVAVNTAAKAVRWRVLLGVRWRKIPLVKLVMSLLAGQMLNTIYPARIGDLSRAYVIGGMGPGRVFTLGTVLLEKLLDMLSYMLLFFLLIILIPLPAWVNDSVSTFTMVVVFASAAVMILAYRPRWLLGIAERLLSWFPGKIRNYAAGRLRAGVSSLEVLQDRSGLFGLGFWSAVIWGTAILNNQLVLMALNIHLPWTASLLILMVLQAGISIPSVPGKIGIFEYSCVLALAVYGIGQANALSYGIVLHTIVLFPTTLLGLLFFWMLGLGNEKVEAILDMPDKTAVAGDSHQ
jgi:uncharacterized protein (TIRG00374 family)